MLTSSRGQEEVGADAFEQELLADIAEAEAIGEQGLAAEWRWAEHEPWRPRTV
jgi:hypothetical protein